MQGPPGGGALWRHGKQEAVGAVLCREKQDNGEDGLLTNGAGNTGSQMQENEARLLLNPRHKNGLQLIEEPRAWPLKLTGANEGRSFRTDFDSEFLDLTQRHGP